MYSILLTTHVVHNVPVKPSCFSDGGHFLSISAEKKKKEIHEIVIPHQNNILVSIAKRNNI